MKNESERVSEVMLCYARESCRILRGEVYKSIPRLIDIIRITVKCHFVFFRRWFIWVARKGLY